MIPILFNYNATSFTTHGLGDLVECMRCESVVNAEGEYELELEYPADGHLIGSLSINNIIVAKVNDHSDWQAFRIYGITKAINSLVTVKCQHLSYDLANVPVEAYKTTTCSTAVNNLKAYAVTGGINNFNFYTDVTTEPQNPDHEFNLEEPKPARTVLLDGDDSIKGTFGGDLIFDNYDVSLLTVGGADRGVLIEYGIDLIEMEQEENISEMITAVYPYWKGREEDQEEEEDHIVYGTVQYASGSFAKQRIYPLNVTEYYPNNTSAPSVSEINQTAREWMDANEVGQPEINLTVSYAELQKNKDVRLHDAITVRFVKIGIDVKAKVISYKYDTLKERCIEVEVGHAKPSLLFDLEDASRLKRGLIPPKRIQNNSIGSSKLKTETVSSWHLKDSAVTTKKLDEKAVTEVKLDDESVTTKKIGQHAITEAKVANSAITSETFTEYGVTYYRSKLNTKTGEEAVVSATIRNAQVDTLHLGDFAICYQNVAEPGWHYNPNANKINDGDGKYHYEGEWEYDEAAIRSEKILDAAIGSGKIGTGAVTGTKIADEAVGYDQIKERGVASVHIGYEEVGTIHFVEGVNDTLAAVWEIDALVSDYGDIKTLVSNNITSRGLKSNWGDIMYLETENLQGESVSANEYFKFKGSYVSTTSITGKTVLCITS